MRWFKWFVKEKPEPVIWEMTVDPIRDYHLEVAQRENDELMSILYKGDKTICKHGLFKKECKLCGKKLGFMW